MWHRNDRWYTNHVDPHSVRSEAESYVAYVPDADDARLIAEAPAMYSIIQALARDDHSTHSKVLRRLAAAVLDRVEFGCEPDDAA